MKVFQSALKDCVIIQPRVHRDDRGFFLETYQFQRYAADAGIDVAFVQDNHSKSFRGVLRGMHFQKHKPQGKLVRVIKGRVYDVAIDIRKDSKTFGRWDSFELSDENKLQVWIPPGFAHGFLVLSDEAELEYKCTDYYNPDYEETIIWSDSFLSIDWPVKDPILSKKDSNAKKFKEIEF